MRDEMPVSEPKAGGMIAYFLTDREKAGGMIA
jgi:hypothetical protein